MDQESSAISKFWEQYTGVLATRALPQKLHVYYVRHVERFIKYKQETRLAHEIFWFAIASLKPVPPRSGFR